MTTTLVTGATGTLGAPTVSRLRAAGHDVRALSRRSGPGRRPVTCSPATASRTRSAASTRSCTWPRGSGAGGRRGDPHAAAGSDGGRRAAPRAHLHRRHRRHPAGLLPGQGRHRGTGPGVGPPVQRRAGDAVPLLRRGDVQWTATVPGGRGAGLPRAADRRRGGRRPTGRSRRRGASRPGGRHRRTGAAQPRRPGPTLGTRHRHTAAASGAVAAGKIVAACTGWCVRSWPVYGWYSAARRPGRTDEDPPTASARGPPWRCSRRSRPCSGCGCCCSRRAPTPTCRPSTSTLRKQRAPVPRLRRSRSAGRRPGRSAAART